MATTAPTLALYYAPPVLAMAALTFVVLGVLGTRRLVGIVRREYPLRYFKLLQRPEGASFPERAEATARNFINLSELPILFYALVPLLVFANYESPLMLGLLWTFVVFRCLHSAIHLTFNAVPWRFAAFLISCLTLFTAWALFASHALGGS